MAAQPQGFAPGQPMMPPGQPMHPGPMQPGVPPPPPPPGMMQPQAFARDCGTGPNDQGCGMPRNGLWAMDAQTWAGVYAALRNEMNELTRRDMANSMLTNQGLTAAQLAMMLDLFNNELIRLEVAKFAASRVTNPMHALGYSQRFHNSILGREYVEVMSRQR
jgi:hypothetical protein